MFGLDDLLMFAAINDAEEQREREEKEKWCRQEREQLEWEMRNADKYHYDKKDLVSNIRMNLSNGLSFSSSPSTLISAEGAVLSILTIFFATVLASLSP